MGGTVLRGLFVATWLAGCGSVSGTKPIDGGSTMDAVDADLAGNATVVTAAALFGGTIGAKVGNIDIVSNMPDNTALATAKTDAGGSATIKVYPGGSVTAIYKHTVDLGSDLITWVGVKPGDTLTFGSRKFSTVGQTDISLGSATFSWPGLAGASQYKIWTMCNTNALSGAPGTTSLTASEFPSCHQEPMTVLYTALDGNNALANFGTRTGVTFAAGGSIVLPTWSAAATGTISISGLPPEVATVNGTFRPVIDQRADVNPALGYTGTPTGGAYTASFPVAQTGLRTLGALTLTRTGFRPMQVIDSFSLGTLTQTVASPVLAPWGQGTTQASSALKMASWFVAAGAGSAHDGSVLHMAWNHTSAGVLQSSQWDIIMPPGQMSVAFPALPAALADAAPASDDQLTASTRVFDIPSVSSYDMLRAMSSANVMCLDCSVRSGDFQRVVFTQL
jgi:hypothetical protein